MTSDPGVADAPERGDARVVTVAGVAEFEVAPHHCFACGVLNEHGMHLALHVEPRRAWTEVTLDERFQGWDGIAHGGIVATILDEVMAWSLAGEDDWGVTARMQLEYRKPVPLGRRLRAEARITAKRRRINETEATLVDAEEGTVLARATGTYVAADETRKRELRDRYRWRPLEATR